MALKPACLQWSDGNALRSSDFGDIYFQPQLGPAESYYVFLEKNRLPERFAASGAGGMQIAELGFGTGLNFMLTAQLWDKVSLAGELLYVSIEKHPILPADLKRIFSFWPELQEYAEPLLAQYPLLMEGFYHLHFPDKRIRLMLCFGDVTDVLPEIRGTFDAWYLARFSPAKNPAMWEEKLFPLIAARTKGSGTLATFSSAGAVRRGLEGAGFAVEKTKGFGVTRDMTVAFLPPLPPGEGRGEGLSIQRQKKIVVLGAGLAGASAAFACAQKGYDVTVIDRQLTAAQETSGNPVGVIYPKLTADRSPMGAFFQHGFFYTRHLVTALKLPSWNPCGITQLNVSDEMAARHQVLAARGFWPEEFMTYDEKAGMRFPLAGCLSPPELCRRLLDHPKIKTSYSREVPSLDELEGDVVIVASGYNTKSFRETAWLPLVSVRGQVTYLKENAQSKNLTQVICHDGALSPAINGIHYAGATFHREEPAAPVLRDEDHLENLSKLNKFIPQMGFTAADVTGGRTGYRTSTPDHLPVVGLCPDYPAFTEVSPSQRPGRGKKLEGKFLERIYLATGFGGQGLSGAPLAGEIIASLIAGDPLPVPESLMPYIAPERFILRDMKRGKI